MNFLQCYIARKLVYGFSYRESKKMSLSLCAIKFVCYDNLCAIKFVCYDNLCAIKFVCYDNLCAIKFVCYDNLATYTAPYNLVYEIDQVAITFL